MVVVLGGGCGVVVVGGADGGGSGAPPLGGFVVGGTDGGTDPGGFVPTVVSVATVEPFELLALSELFVGAFGARGAPDESGTVTTYLS